MLGSNQRDTLQKLAAQMCTGEPKHLLIVVHPFRYFTREAGGGCGHPITCRLVYTGDGEEERPHYLSTCHDQQTAVAKGQEIGRYLCDELGLSREHVKLRANP